MKIAQNPLSKNLAKIFGNKHNKEFKDKANEVIKKIELKCSKDDECKLTEGSIKNWIMPQKENEKLSYRWPSMAILIKLANALEIELWDFFIDHDQCLDLQTISPVKKRIIEKILILKETDRLISAERAINDQLEIENLRKSKAPSDRVPEKDVFINSTDKKN